MVPVFFCGFLGWRDVLGRFCFGMFLPWYLCFLFLFSLEAVYCFHVFFSVFLLPSLERVFFCETHFFLGIFLIVLMQKIQLFHIPMNPNLFQLSRIEGPCLKRKQLYRDMLVFGSCKSLRFT